MLKDDFPILAAVVLLETRVRLGQNLTRFMRQMERDFLIQALEKAGGSRTLAAELLGIKRTCLVMKMKSHKIKFEKS